MKLVRISLVTTARLGRRSCFSEALEKSTMIVRYRIMDFLLMFLLNASTCFFFSWSLVSWLLCAWLMSRSMNFLNVSVMLPSHLYLGRWEASPAPPACCFLGGWPLKIKEMNVLFTYWLRIVLSNILVFDYLYYFPFSIVELQNRIIVG